MSVNIVTLLDTKTMASSVFSDGYVYTHVILIIFIQGVGGSVRDH